MIVYHFTAANSAAQSVAWYAARNAAWHAAWNAINERIEAALRNAGGIQ